MSPDMLSMVCSAVGLIATIFWGIWRLATIANKLQASIDSAVRQIGPLEERIKIIERASQDVAEVPALRARIADLGRTMAEHREDELEKLTRLEAQVGSLREMRATRSRR